MVQQYHQMSVQTGGKETVREGKVRLLVGLDRLDLNERNRL